MSWLFVLDKIGSRECKGECTQKDGLRKQEGT